MTADEQIAHEIGWLEGFGAAIWALVETQGKPMVDGEYVAEYDGTLERLRGNVLGETT